MREADRQRREAREKRRDKEGNERQETREVKRCKEVQARLLSKLLTTRYWKRQLLLGLIEEGCRGNRVLQPELGFS